MTLSLTIGRDSFKLCHKEGARTTVWDVSKNDSEESLIQTFRDVIAFVEGGHPPPASVQDYQVEPTFRVGIDPAGDSVAVVQQSTNGWATYVAHEAPELPERLLGEVELVQPGEDA